MRLGATCLLSAFMLITSSLCASAQETNAATESQIHRVVFVDLFTRLLAANGSSRDLVLCLGINAPIRTLGLPDSVEDVAPPDLNQFADPDAGLLSVLRRSESGVRPWSACELRQPIRPSGYMVHEKKTASDGLLFWSRAIRIDTDSTATALGGYYQHGLSSGEWRCRLRRAATTWRILDCQLQWIS